MKKDRFYYKCTVVNCNGTQFSNPLMLKELYLLASILKENKSVTIERIKTSPENYKYIFG